MKKVLLSTILLAAFAAQSHAQSNRAFAFTADTKGSYNWNSVREIDLSTGAVVRNVFLVEPNLRNTQPTSGMVAATAYDKKNNRLYYTPMFGGTDLRYFDLNSSEAKSVSITSQQLRSFPLVGGEGEVVTRMSFASDGFGYAITNDGNHFIRFSTDAKPVITDFGNLIDSKKNNGISVHNQCSSWGGDVVGDAYGNLYLFTMKNNVFKINIQTKVTEHIGTVKNLPTDFTVNGAAVNANGDVVLSSAANTSNYYKVNLSTLDAAALDKTEATVYNASDLANGNLAYETKATPTVLAEVRGNNAVSIYPNPAVSKFFKVSFEKVPAGKYTIELSDVSGRKALNKVVIVNGEQTETVTLPKAAGAGMYFIKIIGEKGNSVYSDKIVVQ